MPAETHQHGDPVSADDVIDVLLTLAPEHESLLVERGTPLHLVGLDDEVVVLDLWDAAVEDLAERGIGEPDLSELLDATTVGELVDATVRCLGRGQRPR